MTQALKRVYEGEVQPDAKKVKFTPDERRERILKRVEEFKEELPHRISEYEQVMYYLDDDEKEILEEAKTLSLVSIRKVIDAALAEYVGLPSAYTPVCHGIYAHFWPMTETEDKLRTLVYSIIDQTHDTLYEECEDERDLRKFDMRLSKSHLCRIEFIKAMADSILNN